jgi:phosphate transport system protein
MVAGQRSPAPHRAGFKAQLETLEQDTVLLGGLARQAVAEALEALSTNDVELAADVVAHDIAINRQRFQVEAFCFALIATEQPVAGDLRVIVASLTIAAELERVGDHAKRIARLVIRLNDLSQSANRGDLPRMGRMALAMLDRVLRAFIARDVQESQAICRADDALDALYKQTFNVLLASMLAAPKAVNTGTYHLQIAHELERLGDRATNIAERIIYTVTGDLVDLNV